MTRKYGPVKKIEERALPLFKNKIMQVLPHIRILEEAEVEHVRDSVKKNKDGKTIIAQRQGQTNMLKSEADISIVGGSRGGGKSYILLMNVLYDINNPNLRSIIFRKEIDDLSDIIDTSKEIFDDIGTYNRSKNDMTWNFNNGGWLTFSYHEMDYDSFHDRYQGKQYPYIGIDEVTQMSFKKFKVLTMSNRNAYGIRNRIVVDRPGDGPADTGTRWCHPLLLHGRGRCVPGRLGEYARRSV